jgi:hypothetical protein
MHRNVLHESVGSAFTPDLSRDHRFKEAIEHLKKRESGETDPVDVDVVGRKLQHQPVLAGRPGHRGAGYPNT